MIHGVVKCNSSHGIGRLTTGQANPTPRLWYYGWNVETARHPFSWPTMTPCSGLQQWGKDHWSGLPYILKYEISSLTEDYGWNIRSGRSCEEGIDESWWNSEKRGGKRILFSRRYELRVHAVSCKGASDLKPSWSPWILRLEEIVEGYRYLGAWEHHRERREVERRLIYQNSM